MKTKRITLAILALCANAAAAQTITETTPANGDPNVSINGSAGGGFTLENNYVAPGGAPTIGAKAPNGSIMYARRNPDGTLATGGAFSVFGIADGVNAIQIGNSNASPSLVNGAESIGIGSNLRVLSAYSTAVGAGIQMPTTWSNFSSAFGALSYVSSFGGTALGAQTSVQGKNSVAIGVGSRDGSQDNVVSFGSGTTYIDAVTRLPLPDQAPSTRRLSNVTDGIYTTDAATVGQTANMVNAGVVSAVSQAKTYTDGAQAATLETARQEAGTSDLYFNDLAQQYTNEQTATVYFQGRDYTNEVAATTLTTAAAAANAYTDSAQAATLNAANTSATNYTNAAQAATLAAGVTYTNQTAAATLSAAAASATAYTDQVAATTLAAADASATAKDVIVLQSANAYTDSRVSTINTKIDNVAVTVLTAANSYTDAKATTTLNSAVTTAASYTDVKTGETLVAANTYTDASSRNAVTTANTYTDVKTGATLVAANQYTDASSRNAVTTANTYTNVKTGETLVAANTYTDASSRNAVTTSKNYTDARSTTTLKAANQYTDEQVSTVVNNSVAIANNYTDRSSAATLNVARSYSDAGFANSLNAANRYTDQSSANTLQSANAYTDKIFGSFDDKIGQVNRRASQGVSAAIALMQAPPALSAGEYAMTAGIGSYGGYSSIAFGFHHMTERNEVLSAGVAITGGAAAVRIGGGFKWK